MEPTITAPASARGPAPPSVTAAADPHALLEAARLLVDDDASPALLDEWRRLYARGSEPCFSVAVVGELARGKTSLINSLLGADLLPVGTVPKTRLMTRVRWGPEAALLGILPDGSRQRLASPPAMPTSPAEAGPTAAWMAFEVEVPNDWLREADLLLVDAPGAGDLGGEPLEEVIDVIALCDAAVVVLNATMALSLSEQSFLAQQVMGRHVPHVMAVLTHLDSLRPAERATVIRHVRDRLAAIHPAILLASAHGQPIVAADLGVVAGPGPIAAILSGWAAHPRRKDRMREQLFLNLRDFLTLVDAQLTARQQSLDLARGERQQALDAECQKLDNLRLAWEDLRLDMRARSAVVLAWIDEQIPNAAAATHERLDHELRAAPDPGVWWQQELPFRLRHELAAVGRTLAEGLQRQLRADSDWLRGEIERRFGRRLSSQGADPFLGFVERAASLPAAPPHRSLRSLRTLILAGTGMASIVGYVIYGPLGAAGSVAGGIVAEVFLHRTATAQRDELAKLLKPAVERVFAQGHTVARTRLERAYMALVDAALAEEEIWSAVTREGLAPAEPDDAAAARARLAERRQRLAALAAQIETTGDQP